MEWEQAWLNYREQGEELNKKYFANLYVGCTGNMVRSAVRELELSAKTIFHLDLAVFSEKGFYEKDHTRDREKTGIYLGFIYNTELGEEGFHIKESENKVNVLAQNEKGILYGVFYLIRYIMQKKNLSEIDIIERPASPLRMINHWDNMDGTIERGYSGESFFFQNGDIILNERTKDYARLMASIGINGVVINNVNVSGDAIELITERYYKKLRELSELFESYGLKLYLSIDFAAPIDIGGLITADPLDQEVKQWWKRKAEEIYSELPLLGGFLIKADSEGRPGPFSYDRTHADGANLLADAAAPFGGIVIWRCFVYNCMQDWRDKKTDRAKAGYNCFQPLDGTFAENVILQIKNGPMDFQVREPVSPLIGGLRNTNQMLELQIAQEYTGQQRHVCYLPIMWKEILDFRTYCMEENDTVADLISGKTFDHITCGIAAVSNTGNTSNWTGHDLAAANLYGYGCLAWNPSLLPEEIAKEWIILTFSNQAEVINTISKILMSSYSAYENYTSPLGIGWMVTPHTHYGPSVDGYEYDRWGTYHRADGKGIGVDRTTEGTGYTTQYYAENAQKFNDLKECPEELLLFFHHVPYTYKLKSNKTIIQHIYDTHFKGATQVEEMLDLWRTLTNIIGKKSYDRTYERLLEQWNHAKEWRDVINSYFYRKSMIEDEKNRKIY